MSGAHDATAYLAQTGLFETPAAYLRVVPYWVDRMKKAVDEANR